MEEPAERKCTNISSLLFCCGFVVLMLVLVAYCGYYGNLDRLTKGYDDCGNICGELNKNSSFEQCGIYDKRNFPKVLVVSNSKNASVNPHSHAHTHTHIILHYKCVEGCPPNYKELFNRCFGGLDDADVEGAYEKISEDIIIQSPNIAAVCLIAFVFSYITLILFRYAIEYIIWIVYCSFIVLMLVGAIFFLIAGVFELVALLLVLAIISISLLYWFRKRIRLVAKLFKEASKALIDMPSILFEPVLTFISLLVAFFLFIYFMIVIETAGKLTGGKAADGEFQATYEKNAGMKAAEIVNVIAFIWVTQFLFGCQHFVIAGAISKWYFTRDKTKIVAPISTTFTHLLSFHLGSVCLGSMLITLVKIFKMMMQGVQRNMERSESCVGQVLACCCTWLVEQLERLLKYLVRNAYIIIAKEGTPFIDSARRAFGLIFRNLVDVVALNHFGDLVLILARLFIVCIAGLFGYALMARNRDHDLAFPLFISLIFAFLIAHCFISVFEMSVDTIFICFCIDCEENDGSASPYYMSESLSAVMRELKAFSGGQFDFESEGGGGVAGGQPYPPAYQAEKFGIEDESNGEMASGCGNYPITTQGGYDPYRNQPPPPYAPPFPTSSAPYPAIGGQYFPPSAPYPPQQQQQQQPSGENGYLLSQQPQTYSTYYTQN